MRQRERDSPYIMNGRRGEIRRGSRRKCSVFAGRHIVRLVQKGGTESIRPAKDSGPIRYLVYLNKPENENASLKSLVR